MLRYVLNPKNLVLTLVVGFFGCDDENEKKSLRTKIEYSTLTPETPYSQPFVDENGSTTVDLTEGNHLYKMFQALNYQSTSSVAANTQIDATKLKNIFSNTGSPFVDISTSSISITGAELNSSPFKLNSVVASSRPSAEATAVRAQLETWFNEIATASVSVNTTATQGQAGKLGSYLVDAKGIELAQVIQKSLIGALQLDYIGNVLLDAGLTAENYQVSGDKNYTELEHNWDVAYGLLTLNPIYLHGATPEVRNTIEFGAGSYIWEYNKTNFANIYPAYLKGRAAIVNNDRSELQAQATFIRTQLEKTIANAAIGYLDKWKAATTDAGRAHAIAEGLGFIYSLRFATIHGGDAAFSDGILSGLTGSANGFWDLDVTKVNTASAAITAKFNQ
jgi:hypothetical protein